MINIRRGISFPAGNIFGSEHGAGLQYRPGNLGSGRQELGHPQFTQPNDVGQGGLGVKQLVGGQQDALAGLFQLLRQLGPHREEVGVPLNGQDCRIVPGHQPSLSCM